MSNLLGPDNESREQHHQTASNEGLARHKQKAAELVEEARIEGAFDKPKEKLF